MSCSETQELLRTQKEKMRHIVQKYEAKELWYQKLGQKWQNWTLGVCDAFARYGDHLRLKRDNPELYERIEVLGEAQDHVDYFEKRQRKGKELNAAHIDVIIRIQKAVSKIYDIEEDETMEQAYTLMQRIRKILPNLEKIEEVDIILNGIADNFIQAMESQQGAAAT